MIAIQTYMWGILHFGDETLPNRLNWPSWAGQSGNRVVQVLAWYD